MLAEIGVALLLFALVGGERRRCERHLCVHVVVGVLALRALLLLGEKYVEASHDETESQAGSKAVLVCSAEKLDER